ncbi:MAG: exodeoxyribonuclease VII large subunit [Synechococcaceae cyanobacterium]|nr:exodeoxyribonuclease VII large subunit [Synechococcaceae cyanobacterium]
MLEAGSDGHLPRYGVQELNEAIGTLLERGFAPRFLVDATVSRPKLSKGHLWLTLTDGQASVPAVIWASQLAKLRFVPEEGDGVVVVGRLNFWAAQARLTVQILDVRPSLTAVLRQFERVRALLTPLGLFEPQRKRPLPAWPRRIALLTAVPSSALADMLRTARERWPATALLVVPIPVQGAVEERICEAIRRLGERAGELQLAALVLARGGGSREDLAVFDGERLAHAIADCPLPLICGLGHEDDTTIADLVADYRAATPTAALVALLPDRSAVRGQLQLSRRHLQQLVALRLQRAVDQLTRQQQRLRELHPLRRLERERLRLQQQRQLLAALSPSHLLERGWSLLCDSQGRLVRSLKALHPGDTITVELADGSLRARVEELQPHPAGSAPASVRPPD